MKEKLIEVLTSDLERVIKVHTSCGEDKQVLCKADNPLQYVSDAIVERIAEQLLMEFEIVPKPVPEDTATIQSRIELYKAFRKELDPMWLPDFFSSKMQAIDLTYNGKAVGIFCVYRNLIDCLYVLPEYRRKGIAERAVRRWAEGEKKYYGKVVYIVHANKSAYKFWNKIFELKEIQRDKVEAVYRIEGYKAEA